MAEQQNSGDGHGEVVVDKGETKISDLWKSEDYWAIWLGFILLAIGAMIYLPRAPEGMEETIAKANQTIAAEEARAPFKTVEWHKATDSKHKIKATGEDFAKPIKNLLGKPHGWKSNPLDSLVLDEAGAAKKVEKAEEKLAELKAKEKAALADAEVAQAAALDAGAKDPALNAAAAAAIEKWRAAKRKEKKPKDAAKTKAYNQIGYLAGLCVVMMVLFAIGLAVMGKSPLAFAPGFVVVFLLAVLSYMAAGQATMKEYGIGYAAWAILFGLLISNTVGTPKWVMPAVQVEYYIKTGLVLLGAEILFSKILAIGLPGIFVAWVVTPIVLVSTFWFGQNVLKMKSKTLNITISADMSVCGVSAAIATAAACRAKKEELTLSVGLSLIFTSIMMIVMPAVIKAWGMDEVLGGAWMGGTIDATGAVAAAGAFLGERALYTAATIKMIQNVLIGVIAFAVAIYFTTKVERDADTEVGLGEIWLRFPKFVLGFIAASVIFSLLYASMGPDAGYSVVEHGVIRGFSRGFRGWFFCLAFVSIGLATNFREFKEHFTGGKPLILYVAGQSFNLALTLLMAWIMFYKVFPDITATI